MASKPLRQNRRTASPSAASRLKARGRPRPRGCTGALAEQGADVAITYEHSADRAAELVRELEQKGRRAVAIQADSADPAAVKRSVEEAVKALGGLDILVNNAGIARMGAFVDTSLDDINALLHVNVRAGRRPVP